MHSVILSKVKGGTAIRTHTTDGRCYSLPTVGKSFEMFSDPLNKNASVRWITTSTVQQVTQEESCVIIETLNSTYKLEIK